MPAIKQVDAAHGMSRPIRPLERRQYRYFVVLAEELHFARAAERLRAGQSNLSREIRSLEHQTGPRLFYRTSRHTELSAAGQRLLDHARRVLAAEEHARLEIGALKRSARERLRIGICERIACSRIAAALATWRSAHPEGDLQIVSRSGRSFHLPRTRAGPAGTAQAASPRPAPGEAPDFRGGPVLCDHPKGCLTET
jgi:DNA-binding transcriptional LysR family regulator